MTELDVRVATAGDPLPDHAEVQALYAAASAPPPLSEPPSVAATYARLYGHSRTQPGFTVVSAGRDGVLVGFAYGHDWTWAEQTDAWSTGLRERLGDAAAVIDPSTAVSLLAVHPDEGGRGLGRRLLETLLSRAASPTAWLQTTDADTPARRLYLRSGWTALGHGPDAPDGRPGLVLVHRR